MAGLFAVLLFSTLAALVFGTAQLSGHPDQTIMVGVTAVAVIFFIGILVVVNANNRRIPVRFASQSRESLGAMPLTPLTQAEIETMQDIAESRRNSHELRHSEIGLKEATISSILGGFVTPQSKESHSELKPFFPNDGEVG